MVPIVLEVVATIVIVLSLVFVSLVVLPSRPASRRAGSASIHAMPSEGHVTARDVRTGS